MKREHASIDAAPVIFPTSMQKTFPGTVARDR